MSGKSPAEDGRYVEFEAAASDDPLAAAASLVRSGVLGRYLVYEKHGAFTVAGGVEGELVADRDTVRLTWRGVERAVPWDGRDLGPVARLLDTIPVAGWRVYGWAAFELSYLLAGLRDGVGGGPLIHLVIPKAEVTFGPGRTSGRALDTAYRDEVLRALLSGPSVEVFEPETRPLEVAGPDAARYQDAVAAAVREIRERRLQKVILSRVLPVDFDVDLVGTYVAGRRGNNPARSFLFDFGDRRGGGFSPEVVVEVAPGGAVTTQPLAGTRARSRAAGANDRLRADLVGDAKEIFEHAISVKVSFEELTRVCDPRTVGVSDYMTVKQRGSVQHLGSRVTGRLAAGRTAWDAFAVLFPAVTASGIPKLPAYEVIRRHESEPRGLYAGTVLTVSADGGLDAALVLRSIYQEHGRTWLRAGAGIVEQSRPAREYEETCEKLRSVAEHLVPAPVAARLAESGTG
ncbi:salicylate synthase [Actinosynnema sp. CS-041913]|uniref:salicylate synthase n=1 Tax=Actinosynnema sp. CS-041913 TaxID=3239917 RepID=UPI003D89FB28